MRRLLLLLLPTLASAQISIQPPIIAPTSTITVIVKDSSGLERIPATETVRFTNRGDRFLLGYQSSPLSGHIVRQSWSIANDSANASLLGMSVAGGLLNIIGSKSGSGAYAPMAFFNGGLRSFTVATDAGMYMEGATGTSQGAGTINATGLYVNGVALSASGAGVWTEGFSFESPAALDTVTLPWRLPYAATVDSINVILRGSATPSVTIQFQHGTSLASTANLLNAATAFTNVTTGTTHSSFTDNTLAALEHMRLLVTAQSGTVNWLTVIFYFKRT